MDKDNNMTGHNSGTVLHQRNVWLAGLGLSVQDGRTTRKNDRNQMIIIARHLLAFDMANAGDEVEADAEIKAAGLLLPSDLLSNPQERAHARWLARGGVNVTETRSEIQNAKWIHSPEDEKANEIKNLTAGALNRIEGRFLTVRRFAKAVTYTAIYDAIRSECKTEIRAALDGKEGLPGIKEVTDNYVAFFKNETIVGWITEETSKRSDDYIQMQNIKKAVAMRLESIKGDRDRMAAIAEAFAPEMQQITLLAEQQKAEKEAKAKEKELASRLSAGQRQTIADNQRRARENPSGGGEEFNPETDEL